MKNILFVLVGLVAFLTIVNGQSTKKEKEKLSEKVQTLVDSSAKRPVLRYNGNKFREYVTKTPRNYSMIVMFTALSGNFLKEIFRIKTSKSVYFSFSAQRQCAICKQASDEYHMVANSYRYSSQYSNKMFFAMVDFDEGPDVFQVRHIEQFL